MNKKILKIFTRLTITIILTLGLSISFQSLLAAWQAPSDTPPNENVNPPVYNSSLTPEANILIDKAIGFQDNLSLTGSNANIALGSNWITGDGTDGEGIYIDNNGNVGIGKTNPAYKLDVNGDVQATSFIYSSDRRLKENIKPVDNALDKILDLEGVSFDWKKDGRSSIGLIAQDVEKVFPEIVHTNKNTGLKSVEYGNLVSPLIEAIKEQQKEIEELKLEIEKLK